MADFDGVINPAAGWPDVPQLGTAAIARGGAGGPMNAQALALSARDKQLQRLHFEEKARNIGRTLAAGSFEAGATITASNQLLLKEGSAAVYQWTGALPKTVAAGGLPSEPEWVDVTSRSIYGRLMLRPHFKDFDCACDGTTDDTVAANAALIYCRDNGIGEIELSGDLAISATLFAQTGVTIVGDGMKTASIKTLPTFNAGVSNMYETPNFAALVAAKVGSTAAGCPVSYGIENCTLDGRQYTGTPTATTGYGIRIYGRQLRLKNLIIGGVPNIGMLTEFPSDAVWSPTFEAIADTKFSVIENIETLQTGREGIVNNGPSDQFMDRIFVGWPGGSRFNTYDMTGPVESLLYPGEPVHGVRIHSTTEIGFLHSYDNSYGFAVYIERLPGKPAIRFRGEYVMGENSYGGVYIGQNVRYNISLLETHNNVRGPSVGGPYSAQAGANPHVKIDSTLGGNAKIDVWRDGQENGSAGVVLNGSTHNIQADVYGYSGNYLGGGKGVVDNSFASKVVANVFGKSTNSISIGFEHTSTAAQSDLDVTVNACNTNVSLLGGAGADNGTRYRIKSRNANTTGISGITRPASIPYLQGDFMDESGGVIKRNKFVGEQTIDFGLTTIQAVTFTHNLLRQPLESEVVLGLTYDSGIVPTVDWMAVISTSATTITAQVKFAAGGSGAGKISCRVG